MNKRLRIIEILLAGLLSASLMACVAGFQGECHRTPSGGYVCGGGYEPDNEVNAL
jgi:hypothetical protein